MSDQIKRVRINTHKLTTMCEATERGIAQPVSDSGQWHCPVRCFHVGGEVEGVGGEDQRSPLWCVCRLTKYCFTILIICFF